MYGEILEDEDDIIFNTKSDLKYEDVQGLV